LPALPVGWLLLLRRRPWLLLLLWPRVLLPPLPLPPLLLRYNKRLACMPLQPLEREHRHAGAHLLASGLLLDPSSACTSCCCRMAVAWFMPGRSALATTAPRCPAAFSQVASVLHRTAGRSGQA
jgi:hypothetical protein